MENLSLCPRSWKDKSGEWLYIFEHNPRLKDWVPVFVRVTRMSVFESVSTFLTNSFNEKQSQYKTSFAGFLRNTNPNQWRVRIIPEDHWIDDDGNKLDANEAEKFFILKFKTYKCPDNPIGCSSKYSPMRSDDQREKMESVSSSLRFTSPDTPSKRSSDSPSKRSSESPSKSPKRSGKKK